MLRFLSLSSLCLFAWSAGAFAQDTPACLDVVLVVSNLSGGKQNDEETAITQPAGTFKCGRAPHALEVWNDDYKTGMLKPKAP